MKYFLLLCFLYLGFGPGLAFAQDDLRKVNSSTQVSRIVFRSNGLPFPDTQLLEVVATQAPQGLDKVLPKRTKSVVNAVAFRETRTFPFNPFEVQRDVIRLQRFLARNGFLHPHIVAQYQFNQAENQIAVIFNIDKGEPLMIEELQFLDIEGRDAFYAFPPDVRKGWQEFRDPYKKAFGERFSELTLVQFRESAVRWMKDQGFAFARLRDQIAIDSTSSSANVVFTLDPGPQARFGRIEILGLEKLPPSVVRSLLTFEEGDLFSFKALEESKRRIFESSQFRLALFDLPPQPIGDKVQVRFQVKETKLRVVSGSVGTSFDQGLRIEGRWEHRNFWGGGRNFSVEGRLQPGRSIYETLTRTQVDTLFNQQPTSYRVGLGFRQPDFLIRNLSFLVQPSFEFARQKRYETGQYRWRINFTPLYRFGLYNTIGLQSSFLFTRDQGSLLRRNTLAHTLSATIGKVDNILSKSKGYFIRPSLTVSGNPFDRTAVLNNTLVQNQRLNYTKAVLELTLYAQPFAERNVAQAWRKFNLNGRLFVGQIWTADALDFSLTNPSLLSIQNDYERDVLFFGGGDRDLRGWRNRMLGAKRVIGDEAGTAWVEPTGGLGKWVGNIEALLPLPALPSLKFLGFLDFGNVWQDVVHFSPKDWHYGMGGGFRFSLFGFTGGADLGVKLPIGERDILDLNRPDGTRCTWYNVLSSCSPLSLHVQIGQTF